MERRLSLLDSSPSPGIPCWVVVFEQQARCPGFRSATTIVTKPPTQELGEEASDLCGLDIEFGYADHDAGGTMAMVFGPAVQHGDQVSHARFSYTICLSSIQDLQPVCLVWFISISSMREQVGRGKSLLGIRFSSVEIRNEHSQPCHHPSR